MSHKGQDLNLMTRLSAQMSNIGSGQHVSHVLLAEFDIDRGSSLTHQYPEPTGTDEHLLAEVMLPDGAHLRAEDWTIFMLNQRPLEKDDVTDKKDMYTPPVLYVLNLVRTKHDNQVRRGAMVKAMALCTRHQYIQIYKPLLLLALDEYFQNSTIDTLASLFAAVNAMDLSPMPRLSESERLILRFSEAKDIFEELFVDTDEPNNVPAAVERKLQKMSLKESNDWKNQNILRPRGQSIFGKRTRDTHFFESRVVYNNIKLPIRIPMAVHPEEVGDFSLIKLISTFSTPNAVQPHTFHPHLDTNGDLTHPIILLFNAIVTEKRVVFLGHGHPSGEVANYVLAACALGSGSGGVLPGITQRAFPYTNLVNVDNLLSVPGFIAGVTNPTFEDHPAWWDVLCNIETGKITISRELESPSQNQDTEVAARVDSQDNTFMEEIMQWIAAHYGESAIRAKFEEYAHRFTRLGALYEQEKYGETKLGLTADNTEFGYLGTGVVFADEETKRKELSSNSARIEAWRNTRSYKLFKRQLEQRLDLRKIKAIDVYHFLSRLRISKRLSQDESAEIYQLFMENVKTAEQVTELLSFMPQTSGGLFPLGMGLFHPDAITRSHVVKLFEMIGTSKTGIKFLQNLNHFQKLAYARLKSVEAAMESQNYEKEVQNVYAR